jgi:hypothetical protein
MPVVLFASGGCATVAAVHPVVASELGAPSRASALEASLSQRGVVTFERVAFARWAAGRWAFIDRNDPR